MSGRMRIITTIVAIVVVIAAVTGVAFVSTNYEPVTTEPGLYVDNEQVETPDPILTIGDYEIPFDEYRYYYLFNKAYVEELYGTDVWEADYDHAQELDLRSGVLATLQQKYAWLQIAKDMSIELSDEERQAVQEDLDAKKTEHGSNFYTWLGENFYTDEAMYVRISEETKLAGKAQEEYRGEATEELTDEVLFAGMVTAKHILIMPDAEAGDQELAKDEALALAEDLLLEIRNSDDPEATFNELMNEYSQDSGLAENPDGYTFGEGEMVDEFYNGTMALEEGEISNLIESSYGYHIVMRLPLDEAYVEENVETMRSTQINSKLTTIQEETMAAMPVVEGTYYADVRPSTIV